MATVTKKIALDVSRKNLIPNIIAQQFDTDSRRLTVTLLDEGEPISAEESSSVIISFRRADGQSKSFEGTANPDGTVTVPIANWALELDDIVECDISVYQGEAKLSTTGFQLEVLPAANGSGDISEDENYDILGQLIVEVKEVKDDANEAAKAANAAKQSADEAAQKATASAGKADTSAANADAKAKTAEEKAALANTAAGNANTAAQKADKWGNVSVTAKDLAPGSAPTAKLTDTADGKSLEFGIPRGENGLINGVRLNGEKLPPDAESVVDIEAYTPDNKPEVGGRNLLLGSGTHIENNTYNIADYKISEKISVGETMTCSIKGILGSGKKSFRIFNTIGNYELADLSEFNEYGVASATFKWKIVSGAEANNTLKVFVMDRDNTQTSVIEWIKLERGEIATDWSPAPEDLEPTVENFKGVLPVEKGGTGNALGRVKDLSKYAQSWSTIGLAYAGDIAEQMSGAVYPVLACDKFETGGCAFGGVNANFFKEKLGIASTISLTPTQLALTSLYESRSVSPASSDMPAESPSIDGELSALDQNMIKVYADLCLNPDSGKSVDDVPENLRAYVSAIVEETLAKRKEAEERYKAEMAEREAEERRKAELAERQAEEERGQASEEIEPENTKPDADSEAVPEPVEETESIEAENQPDNTPQDSGEKEATP